VPGLFSNSFEALVLSNELDRTNFQVVDVNPHRFLHGVLNGTRFLFVD